MSYVEVRIERIDALTITEVNAYQPRKPFETAKLPPYRLEIVTNDDLALWFDCPQELADMLEVVWLAHEYGRDGEDEAETLADLRAVMAARKARQ
ncbi:MAG: hypothetical protein LCH61_01035 [Proteobacteria bacterium]|nr:hypothetical protein [Pseudomonadota bacterium]